MTISGAHPISNINTPFPFNGRKNVIVPRTISGIAQTISFFPPYSFILYQLSSDSNDLLNLTPYKLFMGIFRKTKGRLIPMIIKAIMMLLIPSIMFADSILLLSNDHAVSKKVA